MTASAPAQLRKRLVPLYAAAFLQSFVIWYGIEKLFLRHIGLQDTAIASILVIYNIVMLAINIPAGLLADRWSRKGILMLASCCLIISSVVGGVSHGFWTYAIAAGLWGVFFAAYQGCYDSIVYDTLLEETGSATGFEKYFGRIQLFDGLGLVTSSLISGLIASKLGLRADYFLTIPFIMLSIVALWRFKEPRLHRAETALLMGAHIRATLRAVFGRGLIFWVSLTFIFVLFGRYLIGDLDQLWLLALHTPTVWYGPINALVLSSIGIAGLLAARVKDNRNLLMLTALIFVIASFGLRITSTPVVIISLTVFFTCSSLLGVALSRQIHNLLPSNLRTGGASVVSTVGSLLFLPVALGFGILSQTHGTFIAAWVTVGIAVASFISLTIMLRLKYRTVLPS